MKSGNQILIADLRTSNPPNVLVSSPPPSLNRIDHPCFSHKADSNGKFWIVFTGYSNAGSNIWKVRPDGTQLQQVTNSNTASFPRWSPDDTKLCYLSPDGSGTDQIVSCGADGSNPMIHTNDAYYKTAVDWLDADTPADVPLAPAWFAHRTRRDRTLVLESPPLPIPASATVRVRVVDCFGEETLRHARASGK